MEAPQAVRLVFAILSVTVIIFLIIKLVPSWRDMMPAQRMFILANICILVYATDGAREAFLLNLGWRWRMIFFMAGIVLYGMYVLEPMRAQERYFKGKSWFNRPGRPPKPRDR